MTATTTSPSPWTTSTPRSRAWPRSTSDGWAENGGGDGNSLAALGDPATAGTGAFGGVLSTPYGWVFVNILVTLTIGCLLGAASTRLTAAITPKEG